MGLQVCKSSLNTTQDEGMLDRYYTALGGEVVQDIEDDDVEGQVEEGAGAMEAGQEEDGEDEEEDVIDDPEQREEEIDLTSTQKTRRDVTNNKHKHEHKYHQWEDQNYNERI